MRNFLNRKQKRAISLARAGSSLLLWPFLDNQSRFRATTFLQEEIIMDFHTSGKGFFFNNSDETEFWEPKVLYDNTSSIKEMEIKRLQRLYNSLAEPYASNMAFSCYPRERKIKLYIYGAFEECYLIGKKIKWKENNSTKFRFLKTPLLTARGRYLKTDMIMFLAKLSRAWKTRSIASCCGAFGINPSTCRGWAKKLLLMKGFIPTPGRSVWDECETLLSGISSESDAIGFLTDHEWDTGVFKNNDNPPIIQNASAVEGVHDK